jgi:hypothetical protein
MSAEETVMLAINPDKIRYIIEAAHVFDADMPEDDEDRGSDLVHHDEIEDADQLEELGAEEEESTSEAELREFIHDLNEDEQIELVALAWIGRGSFSIEEIEDAREEARRGRNERTAEYLMGLPLLPDYLQEALSAYEALEIED